MLSRLLWVGLGGGVGSMLRYALAGLVQRGFASFPTGTLAVNVIGCVTIGFLHVRLTDAPIDPHLRTAILTGVLGGFTTFSTFSLETMKLAEDQEWGLAGANVLVSVSTCLAAAWIGLQLGRWLVPS